MSIASIASILVLLLPLVSSLVAPRHSRFVGRARGARARRELLVPHAYTPLLQSEVTDVVYFEVAESDDMFGVKPIGRIEIGLYGKVVPKTVLNFKDLCAGCDSVVSEKRLVYAGSAFHRIIPEFMVQGGDFTTGDGRGGESIFGPKFADENFELKHKGVGVLSMANSGPDSNGSQFFLTTAETPWLDNKHVVFGTVLSGYDECVKKMEAFGSEGGRPSKRIVITGSGVVSDGDEGDDDDDIDYEALAKAFIGAE